MVWQNMKNISFFFLKDKKKYEFFEKENLGDLTSAN